MEDLGGIAASALGGGVTGVIGSVIGRVFGVIEARVKRKDRELEMIHEKDRWEHEAELFAAQIQARAQEAEIAIKASEVAGSWNSLQASLDAEASIGKSYLWVEAIRALTRPSLTIMLILLLWAAWATGALNIDQRGQLLTALIYVSTTAIVWWFGDRAPRAKT